MAPDRLGRQHAAEVVRRALTLWRRSIQVRVVASTVVLSALVIGIVGWFLVQQTRDGLLEQREDAAVSEATRVTAEANDRLRGVPPTETDVVPAAHRPGRADHRARGRPATSPSC